MRAKEHHVIKARGISFIDEKAVKIKGSEVEFSLQTIEKILSLKPEERQAILKQKEEQQERVLNKERKPVSSELLYHQLMKEKQWKTTKETKKAILQNDHQKIQTQQNKLIDVLMKPEQQVERLNPSLLPKKKRKRKRLHL
jgi:hypothetical protein